METKKFALIAGACTNNADAETVELKFMKKQMELEKMDYFVYNPMAVLKQVNLERKSLSLETLDVAATKDRNKIMGLNISLMGIADEIYLLPNWEDCEIASKIEAIAKIVPIPVIYPS